MKKGTKIGLLIAGICVGLGLMFTVIGVLAGAKSGVVFDSEGLHVLEDEPYSFESEKLKNIKNIKVSVYDAALEVLPSEDDTFRVVVNMWRTQNEPELRIEGDTISLVQEIKGWSIFRFDFINLFRYWSEDNKVTVYVPEDASVEEVNFKTSNGKILVNGALTVDTLKLDTSNGTIEISDIKTVERADIHTSNGRVACAGTFAGRTDIKTSNGKVVLSGVYRGTTRCKTSNGAIEAELNNPRKDYNISAETSNGSIRVDGNKISDDFSEDNHAANDIDFDTSNGSVTLNFGK